MSTQNSENIEVTKAQEDKQLLLKDLCKTCKHCWSDLPLSLDHLVPHCELVDNWYGYINMGVIVSYPCLECPFDSYIKKK
ncbi:hypothetical protein J6O48_13130 [bacterium]|nr:hypothetical protein [bacterium]